MVSRSTSERTPEEVDAFIKVLHDLKARAERPCGDWTTDEATPNGKWTMTGWKKRLAKELADPATRREMTVGRASAALSTLIAQRLAAKGMTQEHLATALDITPGAVSRKLKEGCDMRLSSVAGILWALDVPLYRELERLCDEGWSGDATGGVVVPFASGPHRLRRVADTPAVTLEVGTSSWEARA